MTVLARLVVCPACGHTGGRCGCDERPVELMADVTPAEPDEDADRHARESQAAARHPDQLRLL